MQKKLIAAAVAALASTAVLADATVYGRLDIGYSSKSAETTGAAKTTTTDTGAMSKLTTSRLGWNVKEDLGGGLSAFGNLELGINALGSAQGASATVAVDSGTAGVPFNTRTAYVGLKSDS
ncbi:MAG TPA: porin, partial [Rhodocyclaceae bacterium]